MNRKTLIIIICFCIVCGVVLSLILGKCSKREDEPQRAIAEVSIFEELTLAPETREIVYPEISTSFEYTETETELETKVEWASEPILETETKIESEVESTAAPVKTQMWIALPVNFRTGPGMEYDIQALLSKGTEIMALDFNWDNEWTEVMLGEQKGWVHTSYLAEGYVSRYDYYYIYVGEQIYELDPLLQAYAQTVLESWGCGDFFKIFLCQAFQESHYNMNSVGVAHGGYCDWGLMQIWEAHEHNPNSMVYELVKMHPTYKTDPYENIYVGLSMWKYWYDRTGDYITALGCYLSGTTTPSQEYINHVLGHMVYLYKEE